MTADVQQDKPPFWRRWQVWLAAALLSMLAVFVLSPMFFIAMFWTAMSAQVDADVTAEGMLACRAAVEIRRLPLDTPFEDGKPSVAAANKARVLLQTDANALARRCEALPMSDPKALRAASHELCDKVRYLYQAIPEQRELPLDQYPVLSEAKRKLGEADYVCFRERLGV